MAVSFFWISNPCAQQDGWKTLKLHQLQQIMLVLFEIYIWKLFIRIERWFWICPPYNVCIGYSNHTFIKRPKIARHTKMCPSVIPFIPSLNDQNQLSILKWKFPCEWVDTDKLHQSHYSTTNLRKFPSEQVDTDKLCTKVTDSLFYHQFMKISKWMGWYQ